MSCEVVLAGVASLPIRQQIKSALETQQLGEGPIFSKVTVPDEDIVDSKVFSKLTCNALAQGHPLFLVAVDPAAAIKSRSAFFYHFRVVLPSIVEEQLDEHLTREVAQDICQALKPAPQYISTRADTRVEKVPPVSFLTCIRNGLADDGGLYVPQKFNPFPKYLVPTLLQGDVCTQYVQCAQLILERLVDSSELPPGMLHEMILRAYSPAAWGGAGESGNLCPITKIPGPEEGKDAPFADVPIFLSEQFHGPTAAFKDFALQLFPQIFSLAAMNDPDGANYAILAATSGDTGVSAICGFQNGAPDVKVMVLYPDAGVSPVQRSQMVALDDGKQVKVFGVEDSDFDFCQTSVKKIFNNRQLAARLLGSESQKDDAPRYKLSSANSINWGRLIPQIVYYFWSYQQLVRLGTIKAGDVIDVCVPTGNFGNILACFLAREYLGLPVRKYVLASNCNDVLFEFVKTGVYDISKRNLVKTSSPSIDILKASNVERFLFILSGFDSSMVQKLMQGLNDEGKFEVPDFMKAKIQELFLTVRCDESESREVIRLVHQRTDKQVLIDPHTSVGVFAAWSTIKALYQGREALQKVPMLVSSTAHWAKFPEPVLAALQQKSDALTAENNRMTTADVQKMYREIEEFSPNTHVAPALAAVFAGEQHARTERKIRANGDEIVAQLLEFLLKE